MLALAADVSSISQRLVMESGDPGLVEAARGGDEAAFRALYRAHRGEVHRAVFRVLGPTDEMEDVIQEAFLQIHRSLGSFRGQSKFSTWAHRVAMNVALQHLRKKKTAVRSRAQDGLEDTVEAGASASPHRDLETRQRLDAMRRALGRLSPKKRAVVVLHDMQGMEARDIARTLRVPVFTVRTRLFYGRRELYREVLRDPAFAGDIDELELRRTK